MSYYTKQIIRCLHLHDKCHWYCRNQVSKRSEIQHPSLQRNTEIFQIHQTSEVHWTLGFVLHHTQVSNEQHFGQLLAILCTNLVVPLRLYQYLYLALSQMYLLVCQSKMRSTFTFTNCIIWLFITYKVLQKPIYFYIQ